MEGLLRQAEDRFLTYLQVDGAAACLLAWAESQGAPVRRTALSASTRLGRARRGKTGVADSFGGCLGCQLSECASAWLAQGVAGLAARMQVVTEQVQRNHQQAGQAGQGMCKRG